VAGYAAAGFDYLLKGGPVTDGAGYLLMAEYLPKTLVVVALAAEKFINLYRTVQ
jgi:hypothetical protein